MKKFLLILLMTALIVPSSYAFPRKVLLEEFTAQWCGPCGEYAPVFHEWMEDYLENDNITVIITHLSTDPWYDNSPSVCGSKADYYDVGGIPDIRVDGLGDYHPGTPSGYGDATDNRLTIESPIEILLESVSTDTQTTINATVNSDNNSVSGNFVIRFALISDHYDNFEGSNGLHEWHHDLLDMAPGWEGFDFAIDANSTETFSTTFDWPYYLQEDEVEWSNSHIVAYVQNVTTREIIQSNWVQVAPPPYNHLVTISDNYRLADPETSVETNLLFRNCGLNEDTYDVIVTSTLPDGWSYSYTTPDGDQNGNSSFTLAGENEFASVITVTTNGNGGSNGTLEFTYTSQAETENVQTAEVFVMCAPDILILDASEEGNNARYYTDAISPLLDGKTIATWIKSQYPIPGTDFPLNNSDGIIWFGATEAPDADVSAGIAAQINNGTSILISGITLANSMRGAHLNELLGFESTASYSSAGTAVAPDGSILGDLNVNLGGGDGADNMGDNASTFTLLEGDAALLYNGIPTRRAAVSYSTEFYRALTLGFPFEAITTAQERSDVMEAAYNFLGFDPSGVEDNVDIELPSEYSLEQNYPNPFNPSTLISFTIPSKSEVKLHVYNINGQLVSTLVDNTLNAGRHTLLFDGSHLSSGIYLLQLQTGEIRYSRKMVLCK